MQKKPLILIICVVVVIIAIILLVVYLAKGGSTDINSISSQKNVKVDENIPEITFSIYPEDETDGNVEITVLASVSDGSEIISITTPDGKTTGYAGEKKYVVEENGEYTFSVKSSNGKETSQSIKIENINKISADNPYIPEGFEHVKDTKVDTGFVIKDKNGNEYVWVQVPSGKIVSTAPSDKYLEDDDTASAFTNSIAKYYGFYIAKYEASKDTVNGLAVAKSEKDAIPWSNVKYEDAYSASKNTAVAYNYKGVKTALINSYAWDTALSWINESTTNYSTSRNYGNYTNQILQTGGTQTDIVNEIADMSGNVREWTTEKYDEEIENEEVENENELDENEEVLEYRVVRGGSATMDKIANSRIGQRTDLQDNYWGFRIILYKE